MTARPRRGQPDAHLHDSDVQTYTAKLTVTDESGTSSTATSTVTVGSVPPTPTITAPVDGTAVKPGQTVTSRARRPTPRTERSGDPR